MLRGGRGGRVAAVGGRHGSHGLLSGARDARGASEVIPIVFRRDASLSGRRAHNGHLLLLLLLLGLLWLVLLLEILEILLVLRDGDLVALNEEIAVGQALRVARHLLGLLRRRLYKLLLLRRLLGLL